MRQVGIIAAAGIVALDTMIEGLEDDHKRARAIAKGTVNIMHKNLLRFISDQPKNFPNFLRIIYYNNM